MDTTHAAHPKQQQFNIFTWGIFALGVLLPLYVWGSNLGFETSALSLYSLFPLFGLWAWMIMWTHYVSGAVRIENKGLKKPAYYSRVSSYIVLGSILLHPGILALAQFQTLGSLPPTSLYDYRSDLMIAVVLGTISWIIFLSYEYFDRMRKKSWYKNVAIPVSISQSLAMILIFVHGLQLGADLGSGWFRGIWILYGIALIPCFYIIHKADFTKK